MHLVHSSAPVLEFQALRDLLRAYTSSPLGQARVAALRPSGDRDWIERQHLLTAELREYRRCGGRFEFSGLLDPTAVVQKGRVEGVALDTEALRGIVVVVDRAAEWREIALHPPSDMKQPFQAVAELSAALADFTAFLRFFRNKIQPDGTLDDRASPELARIRRDIEKQRRAIQESLRGYLRRLAEGGAVQDELITIRGERFVIPVKTEQKKRVNGVVHGASSSGQTVFVEPLETIEQNNELVRMLEEEAAEVHRILLEMTARVREHADAILAAVDVLSELELQSAKARFAEDYDCVAPAFCNAGASPAVSAGAPPAALEDGRFILRSARHPLLERTLRQKNARIVPVTVELEGDARQLIISGPKSGGKSVSL